MAYRCNLTGALLAIPVKWWKHHEAENWFYPVLLAAVCTAAMLVLLIPGLPIGHDLHFHLLRIDALAEAISHGNVPAKIYPGIHDTGYANGIFYGDLFLYLPALLVWCHVPLLIAYKLFLAVIYFGSAFAMYHAARVIADSRRAGFHAAVLYTMSSYAASILFIRAALGEVQCLPFLPLVLLGLYQALFGDPRRADALIWGTVGIVYAHNITLVLTGLICAAICFASSLRLLRRPQRLLALCRCGVWVMLLSLAFLAPLLEFLGKDRFLLSTTPGKDEIWERAVPVLALFLELPYSKLTHWIPAGMGTFFLVILFLRLRHRFPAGTAVRWSNVCLIAGVAALLGSTLLLPWQGLFSLLKMIQFPWRLYLPALALLSCGGGLAIRLMAGANRRRQLNWLALTLAWCGFSYFFQLAYLYTAKFHEGNIYRGEAIAEERSSAGRQYYPVGTDWETLAQWDQPQLSGGSAVIETFQRDGRKWRLTFSHNQNATFELPVIAYRGYAARLNDETPLAIGKSDAQRLTVRPEVDHGTITVYYAGTTVQHLSLAISLTALGVYGTLWLRRRKREQRRDSGN